ESNLPTPSYIKEAATQALADGYTFYTENAGLPSLRAAVANKVAELHGLQLDPAAEVVITASGVQALNLTIRCTINPGDEALILTPNWPNAGEIVKLYGATPVEVPFVTQGDRFTLDLAALEAAVTPRTRLLVYTSPSNPLGWVATLADQQTLLDFCRRHGLGLLADEVYERVYFAAGGAGSAAPSILRLCSREDAVIVVNSFSKSYCMTGWRLGWAISRRDLIRRAIPLNEFIISHAPTFIQKAGEAALAHGEDEIAARAELFHERMEFCYRALAGLKGVTAPKPDGAFYLFPRLDGVTDSFSFALDLLRTTKVSVAPGVAFGRGGEGAIRICTASDLSILEPAMERFCRFVERG
nr:pyridoxal phosphate-dependent aminotransferase [Caldilineaceae bacterium]